MSARRESIPAQLIDARIEERWDEGYLRNSGEALRPTRCGAAAGLRRRMIAFRFSPPVLRSFDGVGLSHSMR